MIKHKYYIIMVVMVFTGSLFSQVAKEDFANINKAYTEHPRLSLKMKYEIFKNRTTAVTTSTETGILKQKDDARYTRIGKIESVENEQYKMIVDHEDKNISLLGKLPAPEQAVKSGDATGVSPVDLEKILQICKKVEFKKLNETQNSYTLILPGEEYEEIRLIYNSKTFFIEKLVMCYAEKQNLDDNDEGLKEAPRMEISYSEYNTKPDFGKTAFTYEAFLEKRNGKLVARPAYKTYEIHDQSIN